MRKFFLATQSPFTKEWTLVPQNPLSKKERESHIMELIFSRFETSAMLGDMQNMHGGKLEKSFPVAEKCWLLVEVAFTYNRFFSSMVDEVEIEDSVREQVDHLFNTLGLVGLLQRLRSLNPGGVGELDVLNPRRVIRALERCLASGKDLITLKREFDSLPKSFPNFKKKVLWLNREDNDLVHRIQDRTQKMLEGGLLDETRTLLKLGLALNPAASSSIGYREAVSCLQGKVPVCDLNQLINASTRKLVSKQRKWFRKHLNEKSHLVLNHGQELEGTELLWDSGT